MSFSHVHISQFRIEGTSTRFYANGNHQCHVRVKILKQGINNNTGMMVPIPLTTQERNSVSTALLSSSLDHSTLPMPRSWNVTPVRNNNFDLGLINQSASTREISWSRHSDEWYDEDFKNTPCYSEGEALDMCENISVSNESIDPLQQNNVPEIIDLFITASATGAQTIMAKALVDVSDGGQIRTITITTNMNAGNNIFNSRIDIDAITPFAIHPNMLSNSLGVIYERREYVTKWDIHHQTITLSRWTLPFNLRISRYITGGINNIFYRLGNEPQPNRFLTKGRFFRSGNSTVSSREGMSGGCIWEHRYTVNVPANQIVVSLLHVAGCSWTVPNRPGSHTVVFLDNYGNRHSFILAAEDTGRRISINRAG
jgi:hypothetical protein